MAAIPTNLRQIESLVEIVARLRGPDGCPWDKEQTHESLTQYAIEETHELVEVLEAPNNPAKDFKIKEELGDVLFQVILHTQLASERGAFTLADVIEGISEKLVRRHPHVFAGVSVADSEEVKRNWEDIKKAEKAAALAASGGSEPSASPYALNVPPLPALQRAYKIGKRTEKLQFDWEDAEGAMNKVEEEFTELREAIEEGTDEHVQAELGDVLFSLAQLSRHLDLDPEQILRRGNVKFETRFNKMIEQAAADGVDWGSLSMDDKDRYWIKAKEVLKKKA
ncbi:MAG: tetrapyrrole methylase [Bdellovibrio sp. ArHS]|uniref:nucleoside triphosphate pyrophosphohydrolase n=1 Tax=Bdellovibrio sp. ArHS TaxID=1569284 RepID=UPI0005833D16|nr:nucleoside triphosphate pyrophosphohydrolase [Bdellovibrio sp. ArHS]KHD87829.1 MAG: tetrapyrrole methylase [Bdellovibrio sp. ArHS]